MIVTRRSPLTKKLNTMELDVTQEQINAYHNGTGGLIQHVFPNLSNAEREFIKTGYTQEDWDSIFPPEEDDE